jgi:membrane fusion protein (multidrug efflux system)
MNFKKTGMFLLVIAVLFIVAAGGALRAADNAAAPGTKCPKKVAVVVETVKPAVFRGYQYFSGQGQAEIVAIKSPVSGLLSEIKVSEGSLVDAGQDLVVLNAGRSKEINKLEAATVKAKKVLTTRQNQKEKNEKAIQAAAKNYQKALDLLNKEKAQTNQIVKAPVAGIVHLVVSAGSQTAADALLLEISNPRQMVFQISLSAADKELLSAGDKISGTTEGASTEVTAEVVAVSGTKALFRVNNDENRVKEGVIFTFKKLKAEHADAIAIPTTAIQKDSLGDFIYVVEKKKAKKQYVTLGEHGAGKTMIEKGLVAGASFIVSGFECLVDGKRIRIVNQEELAGQKNEALTKEKVAAVAELKKEGKEQKAAQGKKATEPEAKSKTQAKAVKNFFADKSRFRVGVIFGRFSINDKNMRAFYGDWFKNIPGIELSVHTLYNVDVWASYKIFTEVTQTTYFGHSIKFKLVPLSIGLRYRFPKWHFVEPFVGAGLNFYSYKEIVSGESELPDTKDSASGFHFQGGAYFHFKHFRNTQGEIFVKYNIVKKTLLEMLPDGTDQLDLGGLEVGIGVVVKF